MSRIYYDGKFFDYPLRAFNALRNLGIFEAILCVLSYVWVRIHPPKDQDSYEGWVAARFGWRLYRHLLQDLQREGLGRPGSEIAADWAAQRIKNLSLGNGDPNAMLPERRPERHHEPDRGVPVPEVRPRNDVGARAASWSSPPAARFSCRRRSRRSIAHEGGAHAVAYTDGTTETVVDASHVIWSMPYSALVRRDGPAPPDEVLRAADDLHYRDFSPSHWSCPRRRASPTTGSTSTIPR